MLTISKSNYRIKTTNKSWFRQLVGGITVGPSSPRTKRFVVNESVFCFPLHFSVVLTLLCNRKCKDNTEWHGCGRGGSLILEDCVHRSLVALDDICSALC